MERCDAERVRSCAVDIRAAGGGWIGGVHRIHDVKEVDEVDGVDGAVG